NQRLVLETGPYTAVLSYEDNGQRINLKTFEFTLYDYHIRTLHSQAEDLKYGWGVISDPDLNKQLNVTVNNAH
ncbi:MAG TPA: hypothetical protein VMS31_02160, partial [Pyrinomonadaceae bacterium]|nr:hypothetical protein [Pyrinomonadaceae bacterium]